MKRARKIYWFFVCLLAAGVLAAFLSGCAGYQITNVEDQDAVLTELADTAGYALGAFAAKDPELQVRVETIYKQYAAGGMTPTAALNAGISYLIDTDDLVQVILAHKVVRLIEQMGGTVLDDEVISIGGLINEKLLETGKAAYLQALAMGSV